MNLRSLGLFCLLAGNTLLSGCVSTTAKNMQSLTEGDVSFMVDEEELELKQEADEFHTELEKKGLIYRDAGLNAYIDSVAEELKIPSLQKHIKIEFFVMRDASFNAFALPNGNVYLTIGLLSRIETEAQLAFIMAHEASHIINRDGYRGHIGRTGAVVGAHVADLLLAGTGLSYLAAVSSIASHSRELETEADLNALKWVSASDYNLSNAIKIFDQLDEVNYQKQSGSIWSSHPDNQKRREFSFNYIIENNVDAERHKISSPQFDKFKKQLTVTAVRIRLRANQFAQAEELCAIAMEKSDNPALLQAYIGESYRLRWRNPEATAREFAWMHEKRLRDAKEHIQALTPEYREKAISHYEKALTLDPQNAMALRGKGLLFAHAGEVDEATRWLQAYLATPEIKDRRFIESVLSDLSKHFPNTDTPPHNNVNNHKE